MVMSLGIGLYAWALQNKSTPTSNANTPKTESEEHYTSFKNKVAGGINTANAAETAAAANTGELPPLVNTFKITEWNLKLKIPEVLSRLQYTVISPKEIGFTLSGWSDISQNCAATESGFGHLYRSNNDTDVNPNTGTTIKESSIASVDGYYYTFSSGEPCSTDPIIKTEQEQKQPSANLRNALTNSLSAL